MMEADLLVERRSLRSKITFWRMVAVLALITGLIALGFRLADPAHRGSLTGTNHIARISVEGMIVGSRSFSDLATKLRETRSVSAVIVHIDSPGGTTTGSEALYRELRLLNEKKPVIAFVDGMAASGGYIAAMGAERIVARETALVGSIGVLFQFPNVGGLLDTIGVKVEEVKSSPLKAAPNGFGPTSPEAREALQTVVNETYVWFKGLVSERRQISGTILEQVSDGRIHGARAALAMRLIDELGGEREAIAWLEREKRIAPQLPIKDWKAREDMTPFDLWTLGARLIRAAGFEKSAHWLEMQAGQLHRLDGLLALWQPAFEK
jgi:protease IV